jgi:hypothetical protein
MVMVAEPFAFTAGVKLSDPNDETAGSTENRAGFELAVICEDELCPDSFDGPRETVAQLDESRCLR